MTANASIASAVRRMRTSSLATPESTANFRAIEEECLRHFKPQASGELHVFYVLNNKLVPKISTSPQIVDLSKNLWARAGCSAKSTDAKNFMKSACVEFSRSQLKSALVGIAIGNTEGVQKLIRERAQAIPALILEAQWDDADAIARNPRSYGADGSAVSYFISRLYAGLRIDPNAERYCAALALVWLDEALASQDKGLDLMATMVEMASEVGFHDGWSASGTSFSSQGADRRHAKDRARREEIKAAYKEGTFPSKDAAAQVLSQQFKVSFKTARDCLRRL